MIMELVKTSALVFVILVSLALSSLVCEGLAIRSAGLLSADGGGGGELHTTTTLDRQEPNLAPVTLRNQVHTMLLERSSSIRVAQPDDETAKAANVVKPATSKRNQHLMRRMLARRLQDVSDGNCNAVAVAARFRSAQRLLKTGPTDGSHSSTGVILAQRPIIRTSRPVKALFILCAAKKKTATDGAASTASSSRAAAPLTLQQHSYIIPRRIGTTPRRALMQYLPDPRIRVPPLPSTRPPLAPPRFRFPPLPLSTPVLPQIRLHSPPNPSTSLAILPPLPPLPPFPFFNIPPIPCLPSSTSTAHSLPAP